MKNIKYILFTILFLFFNIFYVHASCTNEEISALKEEASNIKITYKHKGMIETEERILYNQFDVIVKNFSDDFYVSLIGGSTILKPIDGTATTELTKGDYVFKIHSEKCDVVIDEIDVFLPTFNLFSLDPLCEGIDGDDFPLCGKYYEYNVSYNEFEELVNNYRETYKLNDDSSDDNNNGFEMIVNKIVDYVIKYKYYFVGSLIVLLLIIILFVSLKKKKKRGVLE